MRPERRASARGQSLVEFAVIFPVLLLLIFGVVQFALALVAKSTLNQAAFQGVRDGTLGNGGGLAIRTGLARGLAPLYQAPVALGGQNVATLELARAAALVDMLDPAVLNLEVLNPNALSFVDFGTLVDGPLGIPRLAIPNERLIYDTQGLGTVSGQTIHDANLLKIRVTYCYPLIVPVIRQTLQALFDGVLEAGDLFNAGCYASGGIPLEADATMLMQTPYFIV